MLDDVQIERKELSRLLATAKDEERKDMLCRLWIATKKVLVAPGSSIHIQ